MQSRTPRPAHRPRGFPHQHNGVRRRWFQPPSILVTKQRRQFPPGTIGPSHLIDRGHDQQLVAGPWASRSPEARRRIACSTASGRASRIMCGSASCQCRWAIWMRLPQVSSNTAVVTGPMTRDEFLGKPGSTICRLPSASPATECWKRGVRRERGLRMPQTSGQRRTRRYQHDRQRPRGEGAADRRTIAGDLDLASPGEGG